MYVVEVIPLAVLPPHAPQVVSYFTDRDLPRGAVLRVPFSGRTLTAVALGSEPLGQRKLALKKSAFRLRQAGKVLAAEPCVSATQFALAGWLAKRYAAPLGMCLKAVLPSGFGTAATLATSAAAARATGSITEQATQKPTYACGALTDTLATLQRAVTSGVHGGKQVLVLVPEVSAIAPIAARLTEHSVVHYSSDLSRAECAVTWARVASGESLVVVGTRVALFLPFINLGAVVVEDYLNEAYKSDLSPKYVAPDLAAVVAQRQDAPLTLTSPFRGVVAEQEIRERRAASALDAPPLPLELVDMRTSSSFLFSPLLTQALCDAVEATQPVLLYSARKAYSGILVCRACYGLARCARCDVPLRVHRIAATAAVTPRESMLVCYHCGAYHPYPARCGNCDSTMLAPSGAPGSQRIEEELRKLLERRGIATPETFVFDADLTRNREQEDDLIERIAATDAPVVIGTQKVLSSRYAARFPLVAVVNADALATSSDYRTDERVAYQLAALADAATERFIVQTFEPDGAVFSLLRGERAAFYDAELSARRSFRYPPFARLALLTYAHPDKARAAHDARLVVGELRMAASRIGAAKDVSVSDASPALLECVGGTYHQTVLLKFSPDFAHLDALLRVLPPRWRVDIDPRSTA